MSRKMALENGAGLEQIESELTPDCDLRAGRCQLQSAGRQPTTLDAPL